MVSLLILVEHDNQHMNPSTRNLLSAALELDSKVDLLVIGYQCQAVAKEAACLSGVQRVILVDAEEYKHPLAESFAPLIRDQVKNYTYLLCASSSFGKNMIPRVAALLDVEQLSDVTCILSADSFEHPIYAGNAIETVKMLDEKKCLTIRTTAFEPQLSTQPACPIELMQAQSKQSMSKFISQELSQSSRPDLGQAKIVVSGGRALQTAENFKLIEELADLLGAAVGASRAAVDAGYVPNDYQVGQTGKVVAPNLYIAVGISGAVQHLAGMKDSKVIVAINKDPDAPIFQIANYGLVADLFVAVPELINQIKQNRN